MPGIFKPIIFDPFKHIYKLFTDSSYRQYQQLFSKLSEFKRYYECEILVGKYKWLVPDAASFLSAYREIFLGQIYKFSSQDDTPRILDLGANIGLSIHYFKQMYPKAQIIALEADPNIFRYLENNIHNQNYQDVQLINKAVWYENTTLSFASEGADAGQIDTNLKNNQDNLIQVEAIDIQQLLQSEQFDFIKMDIEGAEDLVIPRCQGLLTSVKYFFIEYHSKVGQKQTINEILNFLSQEGFRIYMENPCEQLSPFLGLDSYLGFDFQMNIYAWKE